MPVMIDQQTVAPEPLGLQTIGHVLSHVRRQKRLVINLLIDGRAPDLNHLNELQKSPIAGRAVFIETADPSEMAVEVLDEVETGLAGAETCKLEAAELLQKDEIPGAMDRLRTCFSTWQLAQDSVSKTAQLLGVSPGDVTVDGRPLGELMDEFTGELKGIRDALQGRDYVLLSDMLMYETTGSTQRWSSVLRTMRHLAA
jgi:hypothetical protein